MNIHQVEMNSLLATLILGSVILAVFYHLIVYYYTRDKLIPHYLLFLLFFGVYDAYVAGFYTVIFDENFERYFTLYLAEGAQMLYLFFYNNFIFKALKIKRRKNPLIFYLWSVMTGSILLYGIGITIFVVITKNDYHDYIFFGLIRLIVFSLAIVLIYSYFKLKIKLFQRIIFYGSIVYMLFGFTSSYTNYHGIKTPFYPIEWLTLGSFVDIIFFTTALNYRTRRIIFKLNKNLLDSANEKIKIQSELIQKQNDLANERRRIATDMHDDLGSGLTKINYLVQMTNHQNADESLLKIKETSRGLIDSMSEIIWAMKQENDTLQDLVAYIKRYAAEYLESNNIDLKITNVEVSENHYVNGNLRRNIFLVVKEILHNMVKHSKADTAYLEIETGSSFLMKLSDNGIGFTCEDAVKNRGNGLGNMKYRIDKMNGSITCNSSENGTSYEISVPWETLRA